MKVANGTFTQGQVGATYTLTVTNAGTGPTTAAVTVTDALPVGLTATAIAGTGWSCVLATVTCTRSDVSCAFGELSADHAHGDVAANAPANVVNTATVSGGGETTSANNTSTMTTPVTPSLGRPDDREGRERHVHAGTGGATYTLTVTNSAPGRRLRR